MVRCGGADCGKRPYFKDNYIFPLEIWFQYKKAEPQPALKSSSHSQAVQNYPMDGEKPLQQAYCFVTPPWRGNRNKKQM